MDSLDRIIKVATVLFAEHGYHGVSTRAIAAAVGLNIATVNYHVGSKQNLYREVFRRAFLAEEALVAQYFGDVDDDVVQDAAKLGCLFEDFLAALLDLTLEHPETPRLWVRRWLEENPDLETTIEDEFSLPLFEQVRRLLERAHAAGTINITSMDVGLFIKSFSWMLYGYFLGGPINWNTLAVEPTSPEAITQFKRFLCDYIYRMLQLPPQNN